MTTSLRQTLFATASLAMGLAGTSSALAQTQSPNFETPYGMGYGQAGRAYSAASATGSAVARDSQNNRVVIDGLIQTGVGVANQVNGQYGLGGVGAGATAIGNQLNVNVTGNYNSVVINSTQINNGSVTAQAQANGETAHAGDSQND